MIITPDLQIANKIDEALRLRCPDVLIRFTVIFAH